MGDLDVMDVSGGRGNKGGGNKGKMGGTNYRGRQLYYAVIEQYKAVCGMCEKRCYGGRSWAVLSRFACWHAHNFTICGAEVYLAS